jgi:hypothetical protein
MPKAAILKTGTLTVQRRKFEIARCKLLAEPFFSCDSGLSQQPDQKARADIAFVLVGNDHGDISAPHLGMLATRKGTVETQLTQASGQ